MVLSRAKKKVVLQGGNVNEELEEAFSWFGSQERGSGVENLEAGGFQVTRHNNATVITWVHDAYRTRLGTPQPRFSLTTHVSRWCKTNTTRKVMSYQVGEITTPHNHASAIHKVPGMKEA